MNKWRFFQGLRNEWRWYQFGEAGSVISASNQAFSELPACMANAERVGFAHSNYQVHARAPVTPALDGKIGIVSLPLQ